MFRNNITKASKLESQKDKDKDNTDNTNTFIYFFYRRSIYKYGGVFLLSTCYIIISTCQKIMSTCVLSKILKGLCCLTPFSIIFQLYRSGQFYWRWKLEYLEKNSTDLSQVTDKYYHIMLYRIHVPWAGFELTTLVVIGTDGIGSFKSNYHPIIRQPLR